MAMRTSSGLHVEWACSARAATPVTCGAAIEVPESISESFPVPLAVEVMLTPGALRSGLRCPSPERGPAELNDASWRAVGLATVVLVKVALAAAARVVPFVEGEPRIPKNGIVTPGMGP